MSTTTTTTSTEQIPTPTELRKLARLHGQSDIAVAVEALARVLELHYPVNNPHYWTPAVVCAHRACRDDSFDQHAWPCPTRQAIDTAYNP